MAMPLTTILSSIILFAVICSTAAVPGGIRPCQDGGGLLPHPTDCSRFMRCVSGKFVIFTCPPMTAFDPEAQVCSWYIGHDGCDGNRSTRIPSGTSWAGILGGLFGNKELSSDGEGRETTSDDGIWMKAKADVDNKVSMMSPTGDLGGFSDIPFEIDEIEVISSSTSTDEGADASLTPQEKEVLSSLSSLGPDTEIKDFTEEEIIEKIIIGGENVPTKSSVLTSETKTPLFGASSVDSMFPVEDDNGENLVDLTGNTKEKYGRKEKRRQEEEEFAYFDYDADVETTKSATTEEIENNPNAFSKTPGYEPTETEIDITESNMLVTDSDENVPYKSTAPAIFGTQDTEEQSTTFVEIDTQTINTEFVDSSISPNPTPLFDSTSPPEAKFSTPVDPVTILTSDTKDLNENTREQEAPISQNTESKTNRHTNKGTKQGTSRSNFKINPILLEAIKNRFVKFDRSSNWNAPLTKQNNVSPVSDGTFINTQSSNTPSFVNTRSPQDPITKDMDFPLDSTNPTATVDTVEDPESSAYSARSSSEHNGKGLKGKIIAPRIIISRGDRRFVKVKAEAMKKDKQPVAMGYQKAPLWIGDVTGVKEQLLKNEESREGENAEIKTEVPQGLPHLKAINKEESTKTDSSFSSVTEGFKGVENQKQNEFFDSISTKKTTVSVETRSDHYTFQPDGNTEQGYNVEATNQASHTADTNISSNTITDSTDSTIGENLTPSANNSTSLEQTVSAISYAIEKNDTMREESGISSQADGDLDYQKQLSELNKISANTVSQTAKDKVRNVAFSSSFGQSSKADDAMMNQKSLPSKVVATPFSASGQSLVNFKSAPYMVTGLERPFQCPEADGHFPDPNNCAIYYHCAQGVAYRRDCPVGQLFHPGVTSCVSKTLVPPCAHAYRGDNGNTEDSVESICKEPAGLYRDPYSCGHFFECMDGWPIRRKCMTGTVFDDVRKKCTWSKYVPGCEKVADVAVDLPEPDSNLAIEQSFSCPRDGYFRDSASCSVYYLCAGGQALRMSCDPGTSFDTDLNMCVWSSLVRGCDDGKGGNAKENTLTGNVKNEFMEEFTCPEPYGVFLDPDDCSKYFTCQEGVATKMRCPYGTGYDVWTGLCMDARQLDRCQLSNRASTGVYDSDVSFICPEAHGLYAEKNNCSTFIHCYEGTPYRHSCQAGTLFSAKVAACTWPHLVPECEEKSGEGTNSAAQSNREPVGVPFQAEVPLYDVIDSLNLENIGLGEFQCPSVMDGFYRDNLFCDIFHRCVLDTKYTFTCPTGTFFRLEGNFCDFWQSVPDCTPDGIRYSALGNFPELAPTPSINGRSQTGYDPLQEVAPLPEVPQVPRGQQTNPNTGVPNQLLPANVNVAPVPCPTPSGLFAHPGNCQQFLFCAHDVPIVLTCPENLLYNTRTLTCDYSYNVHCYRYDNLG